MTTQAQQKPAHPVTALQQQQKDSRAMVRDLIEKMKPQIKLALPRHMDPNRMARVFLTAVQRVPKLLLCTQESLAGALITASQLGLEPDGIMGHGYLIPFENRREKRVECQFMPGYRGLMKVARQSGEISTLYARAVHRKDHFKYTCGLEETIEHVPYEPDIEELNARAASDKWTREQYEKELSEAADRGVLRGVYAVAKFKDGGYQFEVMSRLDVDLVRARSRSADDGPWVTDYEAMALKTVMKRLCKWIPGSVEKDQAVGLIDRAEAGIPQDLGAIIDTTVEVSDPDPAPAAAPKTALDKIVDQAKKPAPQPEPKREDITDNGEQRETPAKAAEPEEDIETAVERWRDMFELSRGTIDKAPAERAKREIQKRLGDKDDERYGELMDEYNRTLRFLKGDKNAMNKPAPTSTVREPGEDG